MPTIVCSLLLMLAMPAVAAEPVTVVEATGYARTSLFDEVVSFVRQVARDSELVAVAPLTTSAEGREVPLVILSRERVRTPAELRATGKPAVLVMANIHAGEVEGKEACQMLLRDVANGRLGGLLDHQVILLIPVFNADGNDKLGHNRHDLGPELAGVRRNGQNLDLNRDYTKLQSPEVRALVRVLTAWDPVLVMDMHTTNGSFHREPVTYATSANPNASRALADYMWGTLFPAAAAQLAREGWESVPYGNFSDGDPTSGWENDSIEARYGSNYVGLRNRLAILDENYSYADFRTRVLSSYAFVRAVLAFTDAHAGEIVALTGRVDRETREGFARAPFTLGFTLARLMDVTVKSFVFDRVAVTAEERAKSPWLGEFRLKPTDVRRDYTVPYLALASPTRTVPLPRGYLIPPGNDEAVANLLAHGIALERLEAPCRVPVERFTVDKIDLATELFQGQVLLTLHGTWGAGEADVPAGTAFVDLRQPLARLVPVLLEPESVDGLAAWGFFSRSLVKQWTNELEPYPVVRVAAPPPVPLQVVPAT